MHLAFVHNSAAQGGNALKFAQLALPNTTTDSSLNKYTIPQLFLILHTSNVAAYTKYLYLIGSAAQFVQMRHLFSNSAVSLCSQSAKTAAGFPGLSTTFPTTPTQPRPNCMNRLLAKSVITKLDETIHSVRSERYCFALDVIAKVVLTLETRLALIDRA